MSIDRPSRQGISEKIRKQTDLPLHAFCNARSLYLEIVDMEDFERRSKRIQDLKPIWGVCFLSLMRVSESVDPDVWCAIGEAFDEGHGTIKDREEALQ